MCAIAGSINLNQIIDLNFNKIIESLYHRGPDEQNIFQDKNISLIHTRLSIQDIKDGQQPFSFNNYVIIFNGEIYNHLELRKVHLNDFNFKTNSDTETLLYMYIKYKEKMFSYLDGMFAFCILDKKRDKLILARDRSGKKPLYLYKKNNKLFFSSELNSIKIAIKDLRINEEHIYAYIRNGFFYNKTTPFENVVECKAGHYYDININNLQIKENEYFNLLLYYKKEKIENFDFAKIRLEQILHDSVKKRLVSSDLEVGAFLSGGIDSSLIVAIASNYRKKIKTFTVKFEGAFDESHLAKLTAKKYNTEHYELEISMNLRDDIEKILLYYGEPFMDSSAIPTYYLSREAKKYVTVILNGDGADELFAGYRRYVPVKNNWLKIIKYFTFLTKILPKPHKKISYYTYIHRLIGLSTKDGLELCNSMVNDIFEDIYNFKDNIVFNDMNKFIKDTLNYNISGLSKMLYLDFHQSFQSDLLKKIDIANMANSLEGRSPFLSQEMLEFAPTLSDNFKINGLQTKFILRDLSKKYLSTELINQPKRGFEVPLRKWVEFDLKDNIFDYLSKNSYSQNFIDKNFIHNLLNNKINISAQKRAKILWTLYSLEIWRRNL